METQFLKVNRGVTCSDKQIEVINKLDKFFERAGKVSYVTSAIRFPTDQLRIIKEYCIKKDVAKQFPELLTCGVEDKYTKDDLPEKFLSRWHPIWKIKESIYQWQFAWSKLLLIGIIINPPVRAECLFEYARNGKSLYMKAIPASPHMITTDRPNGAIDIGGGANGINDEVEIVSGALTQSPDIGIRNMVIERENNCLHLNII